MKGAWNASGQLTLRAIFVSYRRNDSEGEAGRLFADLVKHFGEASVFMDVAAIEIGRDFRKAIDESVAGCGVLLAIIGRNWIDAKNEEGKRRLDDPNDFVRLETASALKRDIPVIPVLVQGAKMPRAEQLPDDLKELAYRNCAELTHARWGTDLQVLIKGLGREINPNPKPSITWWKSRTAIFALLLGALVAAVLATYALRPMQTTVPDVTGGTLADATSKLEAAHLTVGSKTRRQDARKAPDTVLAQSPSPESRVKSGMAIDLVLAQGPATVEVPALLGMSLETAQQTLRERQLKLGNISRLPRPDVAQNTVLDEFPKPGEMADVGSTIDLEVSEEVPSVPVEPKKRPPDVQAPPPKPVMVEVPLLVGQSLQAAEQMLRGRQLKLGNISEQSTPAATTVLDQFPKSGEKVAVGSTVDLVTWSPRGGFVKRMSTKVPLVPKGPSALNQGSPTSVSVTISRATCSVAGPDTFHIEMAGRVTVPVGQKGLFYAEASGPGGGRRWRPSCQSWGAADSSDGTLSNVSCVHRPNDPPVTEWQATTTVNLPNTPTSVYAGIFSDKGKAGGDSKPLTCGQ
jgi:beta-lactam-binding protein with PASTA domain